MLIATSLADDSRSQIVAREALALAGKNEGHEASLVDLRRLSLPFCGPEASWSDTAVADLRQELSAATHLIFAVPIYNYDVNAAAKNVVELMGGDVFAGKTVGFICCAGGRGSYMSILSFANSLMLDFRCWIVPRFVYVTGEDFKGDELANPEVRERLQLLLQEALTGPGGPVRKKR